MNWITVEKSYMRTSGTGPLPPAITYNKGCIAIRQAVRRELAGRNIEVRVSKDNGKVSIMLAYATDRTPHSRLMTSKTANISLSSLKRIIGTSPRTLSLSEKTQQGFVFSEE